MQTSDLKGLPVIESESCPKGTMFLVPPVYKVRHPGESILAWAARIMAAYRRGEIVAITGLKEE